jgi:hypothetical protein
MCASCGYDLRGLPTADKCPECGGIERIDAEKRAIAKDRRQRRMSRILKQIIEAIASFFSN